MHSALGHKVTSFKSFHLHLLEEHDISYGDMADWEAKAAYSRFDTLTMLHRFDHFIRRDKRHPFY